VNRVLIIGMADSIHLARWIAQFKDSKYEIHFFPSGKFRKFTHEFKTLKETMPRLKVHSVYSFGILPGYFDFLFLEISKKLFRIDLRRILLRRLVSKLEFSVVHAIEIQHGGYLLNQAINGFQKNFKLIVTNWGSDLFFYSEIEEHRAKIKSLLAHVDFYSAECRRDYSLATDLGYKGAFLPLIPNAGGFSIQQIPGIPASERRLILVKSNGGTFGNIAEITPVITRVLGEFQEYSAHFYSVTSDVYKDIEEIRKLFPDRVTLSTSNQRLSHSHMLSLFGRARIYLASSKSDGISTSFLEALISGAYPIQSDTSCANEWISLGFRGSVVANDSAIFESSLRSALTSDELVNSSQATNLNLAKEFLDKELISRIARNFYDENYLSSKSSNNQLGDR
jgi:hypothetical protein